MLKVLLKKQLREIFRSYFYDAKKNRRRSKGSTIGLIVMYVLLMVGVMGGMFSFIAVGICGPFLQAGMDWLYFALMGLMAVFIGAFGSVFNTYSSLYLAKDNDLLLAMPIPVRCIMASRLLSVYLMGLMYSAVVIVPAVIIYWIFAPLSVGKIVGSVLLVLLLSLIVMILSCLLGWAVAKISLKLKNKSVITVLVSLLFFAAYYFVYFKAQSWISDLVENAAVYGAQIKNKAYPLYAFGSVGAGDWASMLVVTAVVAAMFVLVWRGISRSFLRIATSNGRMSRKVYRAGKAQARSVPAALLQRELRHFLSSPGYMLNCGMGVLFLPVCGVLLLVRGNEWLGTMNAFFGAKDGCTTVLLCTAICLIATMNNMDTPSVSLEGKSLWLMQSLPMEPWQPLRAKLHLQLLLTAIPVLLCALCIALLGAIPAAETLMILIAAEAFVLLAALAGLFLGLKMPNLHWTNEIVPIKQGVNVMLTLLGGWVYAVAMCALYFLFGWQLGAVGYLMLFTLITLAFSAGLYVWLRRKGGAVFATL